MELSTTPKNKGLFGQDSLVVKNRNYVWSLKIMGPSLLGRFSKDNEESWSETLKLAIDYHGFFCFTISDINTLHILYKNSQGDTVYIQWKDTYIFVENLSQKINEYENITYHTILANQNNIYLIYFTQDSINSLWKLKYCSKNSKDWTSPIVIDEGSGNSTLQGTAAIEPSGKIHFIYPICSKSKYQLIYKNKNFDSTSWSDREIIANCDKSNLNPYMVIDSKNTLHLVWLRSDGRNYRVMYRKKTQGGWMVGGWSKSRYLSSSGSNAYSPIIGITANKIIVLWRQTEGIYQAVSLNDGISFDSPTLKIHSNNILFKNVFSIDFLSNPGLHSISSFDTGHTTIAFLTEIFQINTEENLVETNLELNPEKSNLEIIISNPEGLTIKSDSNMLKQDLSRINNTIQNLIFRTEDVQLTNLQMEETILEYENAFKILNNTLSEKSLKLKKLEEKNLYLESLLATLKNNIKKPNSENKSLKQQNISLSKKLSYMEQINKDLLKKLQQKEELQKNLNNSIDMYKRELNNIKNSSFWKKLFS